MVRRLRGRDPQGQEARPATALRPLPAESRSMKRALEIGRTVAGKPFTLPLDFVARTLGIIAVRGAGKTVAATVIAEEMCEAGLPWIAFDPTPGGVWWGLRVNPDGSAGGYPVLVIGGKHGDLPFHKDRAGQLAEAVVRENVCCVVDVSRESKTTWRAFVADFCDRLMELEPATPRHIFLEEAPEFVPQKPLGEQKRSLAAIDRLVRLGRNAGYGATLISQRTATIQKDVLTQCETLLAMRSVGEPDRRALKGWIAECVSPTPGDPEVERFLGSLPELPDGEGWLWSPQWLKVFELVKIRARKTYHPGATRTVGTEAPPQVELSDVRDFVERFSAVLAAEKPKTKHRPEPTPSAERVEARRRVALDKGPDPVFAEPLKERIAELEAEAGRLRGQNADLYRQLGAAKATISTLRTALEPQYKAMQRLFAELDSARADAGGIDRTAFEAWFPKLRGGARTLLQVLLERGPELSIRQLAVLARRKAGNGTWRADIGQLRSCGLVEPGDPVKLRVP
jgi:uncharacterized protein